MDNNPAAVPPKIDPETVANRRTDLFILDVRNAEDFDEWSIDGSHNVPVYDELLDEEFGGLAEATADLPTDEEISVVCVAGVTSARAAQFLRERGFAARSVAGGMQGWGSVHRRFDVEGAEGVVQLIRPGTGCVSYLVHDRGEGIAVDPSRYTDEYVDLAADLGVELVGAVDTHAHADHLTGGPALADRLDVPYFVHEADSVDRQGYLPLTDGETVPVGGLDLDVVHTPGHTPGSVSLHLDETVLTGDTVFVRSVGRPDLARDDEAAVRDAAASLHESVERLRDLPDDTLVLPGHLSDDDVRPLATTLYGLERHNDLVGVEDSETFVDAVADDLGETPANQETIKAVNRGREPRDAVDGGIELGPNNCAAS